MEESTAIQHFLDYLKFEKRFSEHTFRSYDADLTQYGGFLMGASKVNSLVTEPISSARYQGAAAKAVTIPVKLEVDELILSADTDTVRTYLAFLNDKQYSKATIARKLATLRSFYKFLVKRNQLTSNPVVAVRIPKQDKKLPSFLDYEQVEKLLDVPLLDNWLGARDRAILEILYSTGIRASELVTLNMDDIDFLGEVLHVRGKGKKERIIPISSSALQFIQHYMELRNKQAQDNISFNSKILFVNKHGRRLSTRSVHRKMGKYLKMAGLDPAMSPYTLRHSFAMYMLNNGADVRSVQELLGHQSLSTTQVYTHPMTSKTRKHI